MKEEIFNLVCSHSRYPYMENEWKVACDQVAEKYQEAEVELSEMSPLKRRTFSLLIYKCTKGIIPMKLYDYLLKDDITKDGDYLSGTVEYIVTDENNE